MLQKNSDILAIIRNLPNVSYQSYYDLKSYASDRPHFLLLVYQYKFVE